MVDGRVPQSLLGAVALVDPAVADAEFLVERPHRYAVVAADREGVERSLEEAVIVHGLSGSRSTRRALSTLRVLGV